MRTFRGVWVFVALALTASRAYGNLVLDVTADERRVIDLGTFGFSNRAIFSLEIVHFFIDDPTFIDANAVIQVKEPIGFVLDRVPSANYARYERNSGMNDAVSRRVCFVESKDFAPLSPKDRFVYDLRGVPVSHLKFSTVINNEGLWALLFYNCKGFNSSGPLTTQGVSFNAVAEEYNLEADGSRNYLSVGDQKLPVVYGVFALVFLAASFAWLRELRKNPGFVHRAHHIMLALVVVKTLSLVFESIKFAHYQFTGMNSVWDVFYYMFTTAKALMLFAVLLLLGTGWSFVKSHLTENDRRLMIIVIIAQIVVNVLLAFEEETNEGSRYWGTLLDLLKIIDIVCCCAVLLPIVWSLKQLREASEHDEKMAQTMARVQKFRTLYIIVVGYIYFTRIIVVMVEGLLPFYALWIAKVLREAVAVGFYVYVGHQFRPMANNPYLSVSTDDTDVLRSRAEAPPGAGAA